MSTFTRLPHPIRCWSFVGRWLVLVSCYLAMTICVVAAEPNGQGAIEGVVTYRADPQRPWRYARYYVKQAKTGELAEAVVAIRGKALGSAEPRAAATVVIDQKNFLFLPETVAILQGDAVKFTNSDQTTHNVHVVSDIANFNVNMPGGGSHTVTFDRAGGLGQPLAVGCVFHSAMRAWIFVFEHPFYQVTQRDGRFRLAGLPAGEYELEMAHTAGELRWRQRVVVQAGQTKRVDILISPDDKR
jgi:plastocyanin